MLQFKTGFLSEEEVEAVLDSRPVDITFVDMGAHIRYFAVRNKNREYPEQWK